MCCQTTKQIPREPLAIADMFVGLLFIIGVPIAFYSYPVTNYNDIGVGVIFGLIILLAAFWDWRGSTARSMAPYLILIFGLISVFLFSYTIDTRWIGTYHLYIFSTNFGNSTTNMFYVPASHGEYNVQNYLSEISAVGGLILLISSLCEIALVRKMPKI
ncbi:MAG TPA: hypothetical protein VLU91_07970 [Nitrososphaerales archaeon]|nr:hypothetical protein [Nitrososphaerales archaeon]